MGTDVDGYEDDDRTPAFDDALFDRRMRVMSLRNGGMTYSAIATAMQIDPSTARRDEAWAKRYICGDDPESVVAVHRSIIADSRTANYRAMLSGDKDATANIFKGLEHEAKLLGLYAPVRVQTGPSHVEFSERAAELIAQIAPDTLKELLRGTSHDPTTPTRRAADHADLAGRSADDDRDIADAEEVPLPGSDQPLPADPATEPAAGAPLPDDWANIGN